MATTAQLIQDLVERFDHLDAKLEALRVDLEEARRGINQVRKVLGLNGDLSPEVVTETIQDVIERARHDQEVREAWQTVRTSIWDRLGWLRRPGRLIWSVIVTVSAAVAAAAYSSWSRHGTGGH